MVYARYFDGSGFTDVVVLRDALTGKEIGTYNPHLGGLRLE